ncbi:acetylglutamate kinase [Flavobacterium sp. ASW18X]|uniref:acetylglutamate kinase n=1 Tax=Flavobacterium sp. ASW18X TaxID=2572595 RepID=UPI0010AEAB26|nr:acetylglutamate kinase [Flavobacterium sp. ASW18X]TKD61003.1 acetylglutamate kinase [Flavobacterium sp. ASW18X]
MEDLSIVKIGGNIIEDSDALDQFLTLFAQLPGHKILVHGGGKKATQLLPQLGIEPKMVNGRRITDAATLEVVTMVYGGLVNKNVVAQLQAKGINAIGLSGADANTIQAQKRPVTEIDYGFAGDVKGVDGETIGKLIHIGLTPVFCALTHNNKGQLLNTNADTITAEVAIGLSNHFNTTIYYCFELDGVLEDINRKDSVIKHISTTTYDTLVSNGIIAEGMLPKMHNCFHALKNGVKQVKIGNLGMFQTANTNYTTLVL